VINSNKIKIAVPVPDEARGQAVLRVAVAVRRAVKHESKPHADIPNVILASLCLSFL
jgi:hypothetical protein